MSAQGTKVLLHALYLHPAGSKLGSPVRMGPSPLPEASCLCRSAGWALILPEISTMGPRQKGFLSWNVGGCGSLTGSRASIDPGVCLLLAVAPHGMIRMTARLSCEARGSNGQPGLVCDYCVVTVLIRPGQEQDKTQADTQQEPVASNNKSFNE